MRDMHALGVGWRGEPVRDQIYVVDGRVVTARTPVHDLDTHQPH